jgi:hypothetical protein
MLEYDVIFDDPEEPKISSYEYNLLYDAHMALIEECIRSKMLAIKIAEGQQDPWPNADRIAHAKQKIEGYKLQKQSIKKARERAFREV